jgi:hypothetical protein
MLGHEFAIPHRIDELFKLFGLTNSKDTETKYSELFILKRAPFISNSVSSCWSKNNKILLIILLGYCTSSKNQTN